MAAAPLLQASPASPAASAAPRVRCHAFLCLPRKPPCRKAPILALPGRPSLSSAALSLRKHASFVPFVARTSDWAQQQESDAEEDAEEGFSDWEEEEDAGANAGAGAVAVERGGVESPEEFPEPPEEAKLFVGNLPYSIDHDGLANLFDQAGVVEVAEVIYNRDTDQSRGFGFVTMRTVEEAEKAVEMFNNHVCDGRTLIVNKAAPRGSKAQYTPRDPPETSYKIYAGNLAWQVDSSQLEQLFSEYGKVLDARIILDKETGRSRGFGFVTMSSQEEVDDAIAALDGQALEGRPMRLNVAENKQRRF